MLTVSEVTKAYGGKVLFEDVSTTFDPGNRYGLTGANGAGKSTFMKILSGDVEPDKGHISMPHNARMSVLHQDHYRYAEHKVRDVVIMGNDTLWKALEEKEKLLEEFGYDNLSEEDGMRLGELEMVIAEQDGYDAENRAEELLTGLGIPTDEHEIKLEVLQGGLRLRVLVAQALFGDPDILLLDEPTNHLDIESILWLETFLREFQGALVITSHDRELLNRLVTKIVEIDGGELSTYSGNYDFYEQQRALANAQHEAQYARQQAALAKERAFIARFAARASHAAQVQSRVKKLDKIDKIQPPRRRKIIDFEFPTPPRSGNDVVRFEQVEKGYGDKRIYEGFSLTIRRLERWAIMGINGAGKSTLLKLIASQTTPDAGAVNIGASVSMGYYAQHAMELLEPGETVLEALQVAHPRASQGSLRTLLGAFGFSGDDVDKQCRVLSGGEKARVVLAKMLYNPPNFLVLDEPTNHLDVDTKQMLVRALSDFEGTMIFVSHDRRFLAELSNRVLELGPEGPLEYGGGYTEYVEQTQREAPGVG